MVGGNIMNNLLLEPNKDNLFIEFKEKMFE